VPDEKQEQVAGTYLKIIHLIADRLIVDFQNNNSTSSLFNFDDVSVFTQDALNGYSDSFFYGSNFWIQLKDFEHIQASGLQLTKSPGQFWVYLGSIMLVLGIFCMIYIQEARLWIVRKKGSKKVTLAFASNREHLEFEKFVLDTKAKIKKFYLN
jgi:cytochrome c biogenesis protein